MMMMMIIIIIIIIIINIIIIISSNKSDGCIIRITIKINNHEEPVEALVGIFIIAIIIFIKVKKKSGYVE